MAKTKTKIEEITEVTDEELETLDVENEVIEEIEEEKVGFLTKVKNTGAGFKERHPKISGALGTGVKVAAGIGIGIGYAALKAAKGSDDGYDEMVIEIEEVEPEVTEE